MRRIRSGTAIIAALATMALGASGAQAAGTFVEPVTVLQTFSGTHPGGLFGWAVSELSDVNGDGIMEAIIGEPFHAGGHTFVYSGRTGSLLYAWDGVGAEQFGYAMADAGDTNRDGIADVIVGAPSAGPGHAYLFSGRNGSLLRTLSGVHAGDFFGAAVSSAGDSDGDGYADVLIGAPRSKQSGVQSGRAYVFSGRTGELLRKLDAGDQGDHFGSATDWTADVTGDRVADLIVGARDAGPGPAPGPGKAYVFSGANARLLFSVSPPATGLDLGWFFVAGVGDVNGDGTPDVYAADFDDSANGPFSGRAAVYSGRDGSELQSWLGAPEAGLGPGREAGDVNGDAQIDLAIGSYTYGDDDAGRVEIFSGADGSLLRRVTSTTPGESLGFDAVGLGDSNQDGIPDLLVSAAGGETVYLIAGTG